MFTVKFNEVDKSTNIAITDITGKIIYNNRVTAKINNIDVSENAKGIYIIKISKDGNIYNSRIIIK